MENQEIDLEHKHLNSTQYEASQSNTSTLSENEKNDVQQEKTEAEDSLNLKNEAKNNFRKCGITAKQLEEIYVKLDLNKRQLIVVWAKDYLPNLSFIRLPKNIDGIEGRIDKWSIKTLDTGRYQTFPFIPIEFEALIEDIPQSHKELFTIAMKAIEPIAIPLALFSSRFEFQNIQDRKAIVIGVDIPTECIEEFINSQIRQNDYESSTEDHNDVAKFQKDEISKVKAQWSSHNISANRYRSFSLFFYQLRETITLPFVTIYSIPSKSFIFLYFRYGDFVDPSFHNTYLDIFTKYNVNQNNNDINYQFKFIYWKVTHNPQNLLSPAVYCQNMNCSNFSLAQVDKKIKDSFKNHQDTREKDVLFTLKKQMQQLWKEKYEPLVQKQFEIDFASLPQIPDETAEERTQRIQREIFNQFETQAEQEEIEMKKMLYDKYLNAKLRRCGKCKNSFYCSPDCQRNDWEKHKHICY